MFDNYSVKARLYPIIIVLFPFILSGLLYSIEFQSLTHVSSSIALVGAFTYLFSQLGRDAGKNKEFRLWQSWGGMPTVQVLRLGDKRIDRHTKQRYHEKLQMLCPVQTIPSLDLEVNDPDTAEEVYRTWTRYLISQTRKTSKFSLVLKELTSYNFRRNLWGLKFFAIIIIISLIIFNYILGAIQMKSWNPLYFSQTFQSVTIFLLIFLIFWLLLVTKNWVKTTAFSYAERLCEAVEIL